MLVPYNYRVRIVPNRNQKYGGGGGEAKLGGDFVKSTRYLFIFGDDIVLTNKHAKMNMLCLIRKNF